MRKFKDFFKKMIPHSVMTLFPDTLNILGHLILNELALRTAEHT
jgi:hypothetical protein